MTTEQIGTGTLTEEPGAYERRLRTHLIEQGALVPAEVREAQATAARPFLAIDDAGIRAARAEMPAWATR